MHRRVPVKFIPYTEEREKREGKGSVHNSLTQESLRRDTCHTCHHLFYLCHGQEHSEYWIIPSDYKLLLWVIFMSMFETLYDTFFSKTRRFLLLCDSTKSNSWVPSWVPSLTAPQLRLPTTCFSSTVHSSPHL